MSSSIRIHYLEEVSRVLSGISRDNGLRVPFDDVRAFVAAAQHLKDTIRTLHQPSADTRLESDHIQNELACAKDSADQICGFFNACWDQIPVAHRPSAQSAIVAEKVFALPELLELIPADLDLYDALRAQQVCRVWHDGIESSVKMQRAMGLRTHEGANFFTPLVRGRVPWDRKYPGVSFESTLGDFDVFAAIQYNHIPRTKPVTLRVSTSAPLSVGARCRRILVCQPPLKCATVRVDHYCIHNKCPPLMLEHEITSEDGIRFGDVLDAAQEAFDGYCLCGSHADGMDACCTERDSDYDPAGSTQGNSGQISGSSDEESGWGSEGDEVGNVESSAGPNLVSISDNYVHLFTHTDCELSITVHGVVTLKDDDPIMAWRRESVAREAEFLANRPPPRSY